MKKILLTFIAVAAVFVACDKDALDQDVANINVLEQAEEINASVEIDYSNFIDGLVGEVSKEEIAAYEANKQTQRVGAAGTEWLHVIFFSFGPNNIPLAYLRSDDTPEVCPEGGQVSVLYTLQTASSGASRLLIDVIEADGTVRPQTTSNIGRSLRANYATLFGQTIDRLSRATTSNGFALGSTPNLSTLNAAGIDFACAPAVNDEWITSDTTYPKTYTNEAYPGSSFTVDEAPFPLEGFLTRIIQDNFAGTSPNFAASSEGAAMDEIIENIENGN